MGQTIKIFVADDHPIIIEGIRQVFSGLSGYSIVGDAQDGISAVKRVASLKPDIVFMDIFMPNMDGLKATRLITAELPFTKVLIFSMCYDRERIIDAFRAGAKGYIFKGTATEEIVSAVERVIAGKQYISPQIVDEFMEDFVYTLRNSNPIEPFDTLSQREREILRLIAEGATTKEIASKLYISPSTVKTHRINIMKKLHVRDIAGLVKIAIRKGMTKVD